MPPGRGCVAGQIFGYTLLHTHTHHTVFASFPSAFVIGIVLVVIRLQIPLYTAMYILYTHYT